MKILRVCVDVWASRVQDRFDVTVFEYDAKETERSYMFDGRRVDKSKFGIISSGDRIDHGSNFTRREMYCLPEKEQETLDALLKSAKERIKEKEKSINRQLEIITSGKYNFERKIID